MIPKDEQSFPSLSSEQQCQRESLISQEETTGSLLLLMTVIAPCIPSSLCHPKQLPE